MADTIDWTPDGPDMVREQLYGLPLRDNPRSSPAGGQASDDLLCLRPKQPQGVMAFYARERLPDAERHQSTAAVHRT
jgi:hypothetical protein